jgi:hypothetical protein
MIKISLKKIYSFLFVMHCLFYSVENYTTDRGILSHFGEKYIENTKGKLPQENTRHKILARCFMTRSAVPILDYLEKSQLLEAIKRDFENKEGPYIFRTYI